MISKEYIAQLERRVDMTEVLPQVAYLCPWHHDKVTPNLHVYSDHGFCFACGKWVSALTLFRYTWVNGRTLTIKEAVFELTKLAGNGVVPHKKPPTENLLQRVEGYTQNLLHSVEAIEYLRERGVSESVRWRLSLGCTVGVGGRALAIAIPHFDSGGASVDNIKFRLLPLAEQRLLSEGTHMQRYWSLPGRTFSCLYPLQMYTGQQKSKVVLTEGEFDAMLLLSEGIPALSVPSGVNSSVGLEALRTFDKVYIAYDMDEAGERAASVLLTKHPNWQRMHWPIAWGKDISEAWPQLRKVSLDDLT